MLFHTVSVKRRSLPAGLRGPATSWPTLRAAQESLRALRDVDGVIADALEIARDLDRTDDEAEVACHRLLQGEELHREVIEVLSATRTDRAAQKPGAEASAKVCDEQIASLTGLTGKLEAMRAALWTAT